MRFPELSLGRRLFILVAVTLTPVLSVLVFNEIRLRASREAELHQLALHQSQTASLELRRILEGVEGVLKAVGNTPVVRTLRMPECAEYLEQLVPELSAFAAVAVIAPDGGARCVRGNSEFLERIAETRLPAQAREARASILGVYTKLADGKAVIPLALPVEAPDLPSTGLVIVAALDLSWLGRVLRQRDRDANSAITIADREGTILAREPYPERFVGSSIPDRYRHLLTAPQPSTIEVVSQDGTRRIMGFYPLSLEPRGLYVSAGLSRDGAFREISAAGTRSLLIAIGSILVGLFGAWATGRALVTGPVRRLLSTVEAWRRGRDDARTGMRPGAGELAQVGVAVDLFMDELVARRAANRQAEQLRGLLVSELEHRVKNTLAMIQAIASQTFGRSRNVATDLEVFSQRLKAMGEAHQLLVAEHWKAADIHSIVDKAVAALSDGTSNRIRVEGPSIRVRSKAALALSMALHELGTNAAKYGALSVSSGQINLTWTCDQEEGRWVFRLCWKESGGPPVVAPKRRGFGSRMIERALAAELRADVELSFRREGLICKIEADAADVVELPEA